MHASGSRKKTGGIVLGVAVLIVSAALSRGSFKADLLPGQTDSLLADDASSTPRYTESGKWDSVSNGYAQRQRAASGKNAKATWSFSGLQSGKYEVWVTWTPGPGASADARFSVRAAQSKTVNVNQSQGPQAAPDGSNMFSGLAWQSLGVFNVQSSAQIELSSPGKDRLYADAVLLKPLPPPAADLWAGAQVSTDLARPGTTVSFFASVGNDGPEQAEQSALTVKLAKGLRAGRQQDPRCTASSDGLSVGCRTPKLGKGDRKDYAISATVDGTAECGSALNAWVTASGTQPADMKNDNNTAGTSIGVRCGALADVSVAVKADAAGTSPNGRLMLYTVTLTNNGPDSMEQQAVLRIEKLGDDAQDFHLYSGEITPGCNGESCTVPGGLDAGQSATVSFIGAFKDDEADCGKIASTKVSLVPTVGQTEDPKNGNDSAQADVTVDCGAVSDLSLMLDADRDTVQKNSEYAYTVTLRNNGPDAARDLQIIVQPPRSTWFLFDRLDSRCSRLGIGDMAVCAIDGLASGETQQIMLPAMLSEWEDCPAERTAEAVVGAATWDRDNAGDNRDDAVTNCE
ncbi:MAG TPA: hypothetical protein PKV72_02485 [Candidatus Peribacteria bacterium]|nr:hypothetical protein [Candidatus Peribacteria bacterium]